MNNDDKFTPTGVVDTCAKDRGDLNISTLTVREHFAVMALQGLMSNQYFNHADVNGNCDLAVEYADGLLKALEDV